MDGFSKSHVENIKASLNKESFIVSLGAKLRVAKLKKVKKSLKTRKTVSTRPTPSTRGRLAINGGSFHGERNRCNAVKEAGYDVIGMVKETPKMFFRYNGEDMSLMSIYSKNKKRRGRSKYLLSVTVEVVK